MTEPELIAARLASAPWFPLSAPDGPIAVRDSVAHVEVDGSTVNICVTDAAGTKREYRARIELVSGECRHCTVPVDSGDICTFCSTYVPPAQPGAAAVT